MLYLHSLTYHNIMSVWLVPQSYQILFFSIVKKVNVRIIRCGRMLRGTDYKLIRKLECSHREIEISKSILQTCSISNFNEKEDKLFLSSAKLNFSKLRTFREKTCGINKTPNDMIKLLTMIGNCSFNINQKSFLVCMKVHLFNFILSKHNHLIHAGPSP